MKIKNNIGLEGLFRLQTFKKDSPEIIQDSGWFNNMILNSGLNQMLSSSTATTTYSCVGTGSNPVTPEQTSLQTFLANSGTSISNYTSGVVGTSPFYSFYRLIYTYDVGIAAGNLTEVGIRGTTTGNLFSRALIRDNLGNPTTFTVLGDEILQVTYELRCYPNQTDVVINNVESSPGVTHTITIRPRNSTSNFSQHPYYPYTANVGVAQLATGLITGITSSPSGILSGTGSIVYLPYVQNSFKRGLSFTWSISSSNSNNINSCTISTDMGLFQIGFNPPLVKTSSDILRLDFELSWGRRE